MLNDLRKWLSDAQQDPAIFDVVLYGSSSRGKARPGDIDIAVIFRKGDLRERLEKVQALKRKIPGDMVIDMKGILLEELFQERFLARAGILLEGQSIFDGKPFAEKIDFGSAAIFIYDLRGESHAEKVKFNYLLRGRSGTGVLQHLNGVSLAPAVVQLPVSSAWEFAEVLDTHGIPYTKKNVLIQR